VQAQDDRLQQWLDRVESLATGLRELAASPPPIDDAADRGAHLSLVKSHAAVPAEAAGGA
jgi:hypothetical protein